MIIIREKKVQIREKINLAGTVDGLIHYAKDQQNQILKNRYYSDDVKLAIFCRKVLMYTFGAMSSIGIYSDDPANKKLFQDDPHKLMSYVDKKIEDLIAKMNIDTPKA
jgi:hypothetical protein